MSSGKYGDEQKIPRQYLQKINPPEDAIWLKKRDFAIGPAGVQSVIAGWQLPHNKTEAQKKMEALPGGKKKKNGGGYCYAEYDSSADYFGSILRQPVGERYGYECIRPKNPCKLYFDIEWLGPYDPARGKLLAYAEEIRAYLRLVYGGEYALYITCGCRELNPGVFKNSYHIVVGGLIFSNNHEGAMKNCVAAIKAKIDVGSEGIDMKVYAWGQMMRTILCSKRGSNIPLRNITGDPLSSTSSLFSDDVCMEVTIAELNNFLVTAQDDGPFVKRVNGLCTVNISKAAANQNKIRTREREIRGVSSDILSSSGVFMPVDVTADCQRMVDATRSEECVVTGQIHRINQTYILQCRNSGTRLCIANSGGHRHENENARLVVFNGYIQYRCFSEKCKDSHFILGVVPASFKAFIDMHMNKQRERLHNNDTAMCVETNEISSVPVVQEDTQEDHQEDTLRETASPTTQDTGVVPELLEHSNTRHRQILPFPHPTDANKERMTVISSKFLDKGLYENTERINIVESSCKTGKTTSMVQYVLENDLRIISACTHIAQVQSQATILEANGMPIILYTDAKALRNAIVGQKNIITTINSARYALSTIIDDDYRNASQYVLILDEFHSIVSAVYGSETLDHQRKEILSDLHFLFNHCKKVIVMDNLISNADIFLIDTLMSETNEKAPLVFYDNTYKAFDGIPLSVCHDHKKIFEQMKNDAESGMGFIASFNTKSGARVAFREMQDAITDPVLKAGMRYYDGDTDKNINIARECLEDWNGFAVIHNSKITTALDYHPTNPINSYNFTNGVSTVCPATTIQMILRNRNIKHVYFCPYNMPETVQFADKEAFFANLDFVYPRQNEAPSLPCVNSQRPGAALSVLREISDVAWSPKLRKHVYSENKFSLGYKEWLWERYLMDASFVCNVLTLAKKRGFCVDFTDDNHKMHVPDYAKIGILKKQCRQDDEDALFRWKQGETTQRTDFFNQRLLAVSSVYRGLKSKNEASMLLREKNRFDTQMLDLDPVLKEYIHRIFTCDRALENNQNMVLGIYTFAKLQFIASQQQKTNYEIKCRYNTISTAILYREMITAWNMDMPPCAWLKPYDITMKQGQYNEDHRLDLPDYVWDQYKRRLEYGSDRPTTRRTILECIFMLSQELFGKKYAVRKRTTRKVRGVEIKCYNYSCNLLALHVFTVLANWTNCNLEDIEPEIVAGYELVQRGPKNTAMYPISYEDMQKTKKDLRRQGKDADSKRKSLIFCDDIRHKRHKASKFNADNIHTAFFEADLAVLHQADLSSQITQEKEQNERKLKKLKVDLVYKNQAAPVANSAVEQQEEYERQRKQVKIMNYCDRRHDYRNKPALKRMAKRALAQRDYAIMLLSTPDELESMFDAQQQSKQQVLQNERIPALSPRKMTPLELEGLARDYNYYNTYEPCDAQFMGNGQA